MTNRNPLRIQISDLIHISSLGHVGLLTQKYILKFEDYKAIFNRFNEKQYEQSSPR